MPPYATGRRGEIPETASCPSTDRLSGYEESNTTSPPLFRTVALRMSQAFLVGAVPVNPSTPSRSSWEMASEFSSPSSQKEMATISGRVPDSDLSATKPKKSGSWERRERASLSIALRTPGTMSGSTKKLMHRLFMVPKKLELRVRGADSLSLLVGPGSPRPKGTLAP